MNSQNWMSRRLVVTAGLAAASSGGACSSASSPPNTGYSGPPMSPPRISRAEQRALDRAMSYPFNRPARIPGHKPITYSASPGGFGEGGGGGGGGGGH